MDLAGLATGRTECVHVDPDELRPATSDVTRCAAGPAYKPRDSVRLAIQRMLAGDVIAEVAPVICYAIFAVAAQHGDGLELTDGRRVHLGLPGGSGPACMSSPADSPEPPDETGVPAPGALPAALATVVCTVGEVDDRLEGYIESLGPLDAWIAQGIALAQLDLLERLAMRHLLELAADAGLQAQRYLEPDVGSASQQDLFALLDPALMPVRLTEYGTMRPRMSYSFWVPLFAG